MPYFSVTMAALTPKNLNINDIKQLNKVAVKNGFSPAINTVKKLMPTAKMVEVKDNDEAWDLIKKGEVQGYVNTNLVVMGYPIMDDSLVVSPRKIGKNLFLSPGVKKGNKELQKEINEIMFQLANEGYFEKIFNDTFGDFYKGVVEAKDFLLQDLYSNF